MRDPCGYPLGTLRVGLASGPAGRVSGTLRLTGRRQRVHPLAALKVHLIGIGGTGMGALVVAVAPLAAVGPDGPVVAVAFAFGGECVVRLRPAAAPARRCSAAG